MDILRYKLPLILYFDKPVVVKNGYSTWSIPMEDIKFNTICAKDIEGLDGQYDWIEAWRSDHGDYYKRMLGFNSKDVQMEVIYDKGCYIITLVSERPFDTIVQNNRYCSSSGPWEEVTLKEAVIRYLEGCIWDGIGENEIGQVVYQGQKCDVWLGKDLIEI